MSWEGTFFLGLEEAVGERGPQRWPLLHSSFLWTKEPHEKQML